MSVIRTLSAVTLLFNLGLMGCTKDQGVPSAAERERRVMTAEEKKKFDERVSPDLEKSTFYMRKQEEQGVLTIKESTRLWRIGAYLQAKYAVSDEDVDFALHLIERGPIVNTDINQVRLRMRTISSLKPGSGLTEAQQQRAIKVIGPIANDPRRRRSSTSTAFKALKFRFS
ncbi:MAG: hypothetical protein JWN98_525 [Abditibacteriota bacterium]|nr:hypothetical protein [Abditibacteriota bacterium]